MSQITIFLFTQTKILFFLLDNDQPICPFKYFILGDEPSIYDLLIAPAFEVFTTPIQDPTVIKNGQGIFRLKRDVYNGVTTNQSLLSILCKYPLHNRHANIKDATTCHPIFSVGGELITLAKSAFILCEMIEWNYPALSPNTPTYAETNTPSTSGNKHRKQNEFKRIAENSIPIILQPKISIKHLPIEYLLPIILPLHRTPSTPEPSSTSGPSTSIPSTSSEPLSISNSSLLSIISSTPEQSSHSGLSSHIDKGKQPATLEKYMRTASITTNNNFIPNHNTTATPHEYSDQSDASE
ncbi:hypothetical protein C2G38_2188137 [Gigaspora rosea]|uniref:Uncharacterized protein n=1 Tax=Gigaspora rosea TaxID=44941 RepID=A0A397V5F4_9GLOM|nr:hypothetical protein C2G38_2188137 [Gigaspora rosea]